MSAKPEYRKQYYKKHKEKLLARAKERYQKCREQRLSKQKEYQRCHREIARKASRRYYQRHKERVKFYKKERREAERLRQRQYYVAHPLIGPAHKAAQKYVKTLKCEACGGIENLERHHVDYSKPLDVVVLCHRCHQHLHHP